MKDLFYNWLAYRLPKKVVYLCVIRVWADVSTKEYANKVVGEITIDEALQSWAKGCKDI